MLETRLAEVSMRDLFPCDLGDGIEVLHDVELVEIEMDCDVDDPADDSAPYELIEIRYALEAFAAAIEQPAPAVALGLDLAFVRSPVWDTLPFAPVEPGELGANVPVAVKIAKGTGPVATVSESARTTPFARVEVETVPYPILSAPYERIEMVLPGTPRRR